MNRGAYEGKARIHCSYTAKELIVATSVDMTRAVTERTFATLCGRFCRSKEFVAGTTDTFTNLLEWCEWSTVILATTRSCLTATADTWTQLACTASGGGPTTRREAGPWLPFCPFPSTPWMVS